MIFVYLFYHNGCFKGFPNRACRAYQAGSAFLIVQLRWLVPRGHKSISPKRQRPPFQRARLMLVGPTKPPALFYEGLKLKLIHKTDTIIPNGIIVNS